jgi:hypothetical protein
MVFKPTVQRSTVIMIKHSLAEGTGFWDEGIFLLKRKQINDYGQDYGQQHGQSRAVDVPRSHTALADCARPSVTRMLILEEIAIPGP